MEKHLALTDKEFEDQFSKSTLDPAFFSHEAHLRLAWIHISNYGETKAIENITNQLQHFLNLLGATDKYNETLTVAAIKVVSHFMRKQQINSFSEFITAHPRLKTNFNCIIEQHDSFGIYKSSKAKLSCLEPDLLEFT